jgi:L-ascorbate metabolism protein UlaG (beta-lactamase superfamily)
MPTRHAAKALFLPALLLPALMLPAMRDDGALAQDRMPSHCFAIAEGPQAISFASFGEGLQDNEVRIGYIGHSAYLIETDGGVGIVTDYDGYHGAGPLPTVVTMNNAHSSHWTEVPDPGIPHVLRGWGENGAKAEHWLELDGEVLIRNVTTDVNRGGVAIPDRNSIFIFEAGGLCIGHLGHLHHEPSEEQYALIGRLDVVMVPVDGSMTMAQDAMIRVMQRLRAQVVLPMHWFGLSNLERFLDGMKDDFTIERVDGPMVVSLRTLPETPTVRVMMPGLSGFGLE